MAILVTGGAGYIGSHTCLELLRSGYDVVSLDNYYNSSPEALKRVMKLAGKELTAYDCDIRDRGGLQKIFSEHAIEVVIHFAGLKAVGESVRIPLAYYENNVAGSVTLLQEMEKAGVHCIVFSSSATVYGDNDPPYVEDMPTGAVTNPYGRTKYIIEEILKDACAANEALSAVLLRYFNPIGADSSGQMGENPNGIPNNLMPYIAQVAVGKLSELQIFGDDYPTPDGTGVRDYIHVSDLGVGHVKAVAYAMEHTGAQAINLGTGKGVSVLELVRAFEKASGVNIPYKIVPRRAGDIPASYADPGKAKELLGFVTQRTVDDMCADTWKWQSGNPDGYKA
ncbi:MAG TPA: UDP-glucose 4-epimerase GalE [Ruminococcaceae bacterium]|nr:UDP-glucose 4-epimerase GalE [Oscillospiraceae bacterium]